MEILRALVGSRAEIAAVSSEVIRAAGLRPVDLSPFDDPWMSFLDPGRARDELGFRHAGPCPGAVRLTAPEGFGLTVAAPRLDAFRRTHPDINLLLVAEAHDGRPVAARGRPLTDPAFAPSPVSGHAEGESESVLGRWRPAS